MSRFARSTVRASALVLALVLSGCDRGGSVVSPPPQSPDTAAPSLTNTSQPVTDPAEAPDANQSDFPTELVGAWAGGQETNGRHLTFTAEGRFDAESYRGTAVIRGDTMIWQVDDQPPRVVPWSLSDGVLKIGNSTYLRDDQRTGGALSLAGTWININGYTTIKFGSDGTFELDDQANNDVTEGRYVLRGNLLTMTSATKGTASYLVALDTYLTFSTPSGQVLGEYTRAG